MNHARTHALHINTAEQKMLLIFLGTIVLFGVLYVFFVVSSSVYGSERQHIMQSITKVRSEVVELESNYLTLSKNTNLSFAYDNGFEQAAMVTFVKQTTLVSHLGDNENEI